jgi:hypothetical protein
MYSRDFSGVSPREPCVAGGLRANHHWNVTPIIVKLMSFSLASDFMS